MAATTSGYETVPRPQVRLNQTPTAKTSDYTVTTSDIGKIFTNTGASGTVKFTLPAVAGWAGHSIKFRATAAQIIQVAPQSGESIYLDGDGAASKYVSLAATAGNSLTVYNNGSSVEVTQYNGVTAKEA